MTLNPSFMSWTGSGLQDEILNELKYVECFSFVGLCWKSLKVIVSLENPDRCLYCTMLGADYNIDLGFCVGCWIV